MVPNLATFAVDDGFTYRIPDSLSGVETGSLVRVPLGGRKVRGVVTGVREATGREQRLRDILAVVGDLPVVTSRLLETLRWAAVHYVAPQAVLLAKAAPSNVPRRVAPKPADAADLGSPFPDITSAIVDGRPGRPRYLVSGGPWAEPLAGLAAGVLGAGRNVAVIAPTVAEARALASGMEAALGRQPLFVTSSEPAATTTRAWGQLVAGEGRLVVATREIGLWPMGDLGLVVVLEEGRPAMREPQTPTLSVREVMRRRSTAERFGLVFAGPTPTVDSLAAGVELITPRRVWPLVEIIDRAEEPPGSGVVMQATIRAVQGVVHGGGEVFVFVTRHGDAAAFRCVACGTIRTCPECGAGVSRTDACQRCGSVLGPCTACGGGRFQPLGAGVGRVVAELRRSLGDKVGVIGGPGPVTVGTERDLPAVTPVALAVVIDADSMLLAPHYRAEEEALGILARVALSVERGRGRRCLVQTTQASHRVLKALRSGRPTPLLHELLAEREREGFPPMTDLLALEVTGDPAPIDAELRLAAAEVTLLGPAQTGDTWRWLLTAPDLRPTKIRLRSQIQAWRDAGRRVRVDVDPVRL